MYDGSIQTDEPQVSFLGEVYDPYFGTTTAEFITEIRMRTPWYYGQVTVDSVKLYMKFLDVRGGSTMTHTLRLSEISNQIFNDSEYYSNTKADTTDFAFNVELLDILLTLIYSPSEFFSATFISLFSSLFTRYLILDTRY